MNHEALLDYAREAADVSTNHQLPKLEFAHNHFGQVGLTDHCSAEY